MTHSSQLPVVAITLGDPSGIGPELVARLLARQDLMAEANVVLVGDKWLWEDGQKIAGQYVATQRVAGFEEVRERVNPHIPAFLSVDTVSLC
jgi:4-hydroxythreonine-4-phosphate dehydrogenase